MEFAHTIFRVALSGDPSMLLQILSGDPGLANLPDFDVSREVCLYLTGQYATSFCCYVWFMGVC